MKKLLERHGKAKVCIGAFLILCVIVVMLTHGVDVVSYNR